MGSIFTVIAEMIAAKLFDKIYSEMMIKKTDMENSQKELLPPVDYIREDQDEHRKKG